MRISDLPEDFEDRFWPQIIAYSVGLMKVTDGSGGEFIDLAGSGTLIRLNTMYGILTAHHVLEKSNLLRRRSHLGLNLPKGANGQEHRLLIDDQHWRYCPVGRPDPCTNRPDLGVILLDRQADISTLSASKSFWEINRRPSHEGSYIPSVGADIWTVFGLVNESRAVEESKHGFEACLSFETPRITSEIVREIIEGDHDYLNFLIPISLTLPQSFGGMSGGGLWRIPLSVGTDGNIHCHFPVLSGVAFYELKEDPGRFILCHGQRSVYETVPSALRAFAQETL